MLTLGNTEYLTEYYNIRIAQ